MYCCVLDFVSGSIDIFQFRKDQDIEMILDKKYKSLSNLQYMCVEELKLNMRCSK